MQAADTLGKVVTGVDDCHSARVCVQPLTKLFTRLLAVHATGELPLAARCRTLRFHLAFVFYRLAVGLDIDFQFREFA